jgi:hypothetical protein
MDHTPLDLLIEQAVDDAIAHGAFVPRWGWPTPRSYNGATGAERIRGWQKVAVARSMGLLSHNAECEICRDNQSAGSHTEIYVRPMTTKPVCRSCHFKIHRRFRDPDRWSEFLSQMPAADWVHSLLTKELSRVEALEIAEAPDVFAALAQFSR